MVNIKEIVVNNKNIEVYELTEAKIIQAIKLIKCKVSIELTSAIVGLTKEDIIKIVSELEEQYE